MTTPTTMRFTDADRDDDGFIMADPPAATPAPAAPPTGRTLTDVLPPLSSPPTAPADARPDPTPGARWRFSRSEIVSAAVGGAATVALIAAISLLSPAPVPRSVLPPPTALPAATPTSAPTATPLPAQDAYAAPDGARLGTIPLTVTLAYQDSRSPGWAGVDWQGGVVWVRTDADTAALQDLAPRPPTPPRAPAAPFVPAQPPASAVSAPAAPPASSAPCDLTRAPYSVTKQVTDAKGNPIGIATGVSCTSQAEAERNVELEADQVRAHATGQAPATPGKEAP